MVTIVKSSFAGGVLGMTTLEYLGLPCTNTLWNPGSIIGTGSTFRNAISSQEKGMSAIKLGMGGLVL